MDLTTPCRADIVKQIQAHEMAGGTHFILEVTSEGIDQGRVRGLDFDVKLLTNITRDHLDYHGTMARYASTKMGFMAEGRGFKVYPSMFRDEVVGLSSNLLGDFNALNMKAAVKVLRHLGVRENVIVSSLSRCAAPRGRLESVDAGQDFLVLVDFAHTPDGLNNVLSSMKRVADQRRGRLLVVFGCGGNRDRGKRPEMGRVAGELADYVVITSDNPRDEDPLDIVRDIEAGIVSRRGSVTTILDRRQAIYAVIGAARGHDVVVIAGKGHETVQVLKKGPVDFDDVVIAEAAIRHQLSSSHPGGGPENRSVLRAIERQRKETINGR